MNEERWFSWPVWYSLDVYENNDELLQYCYHRKNIDNGNKKTNVGGWQSNNISQNENVIIQNFCVYIKKKLFPISEKFKIKLKFGNFWININQKDNYNHIHVHSGCVFSGVYYVNANSNQGNLIFTNPNISWNQHALSGMIDTYNEYYPDEVFYAAETGKLFLFPSFLAHRVEKNETNFDRVSIAFNLQIDD